MRKKLAPGLFILLGLAIRSLSAQPLPMEAPAGLVVHLGSTDGALEAQLAAGGTALVHGLSPDPACVPQAREMLIGRNLYGLASIQHAQSLRQLSYADNLVSLLIADLDDLRDKAPAEAEIERVLSPGGRACLRIGGKWIIRAKQRPPEMDDWTHFDHGADGNGVSHDKLVGPPTLPQWLSTRQPLPRQGNPAGYSTATAFRSAGGRVFHGWYEYLDPANPKKSRQCYVAARDGFNGLPLWHVKTPSLGRLDWQTVTGDDRLFTFIDKGTPVSLDAATGRIITRFEKAGRLSEPAAHTMLRYARGVLIETAGDTLYAMEGRSGQLRWSHSQPGGVLLFPTVDAENGKVFVVAAAPKAIVSDRWPCAIATAVLCIDLQTGRTLWRCEDIAGLYIGQMIPSQRKLAMFGAVGIGGGSKDSGLVAALDAATGKLLWKRRIEGGGVYAKQIWGLSMLIRDGSLFYATPWHLYRMDLATGERFEHWISSYNQRCNRFAATERWFIMGLGSFIDERAIAHIYTAVRSGCAQGPALANGMCYYTPSHCGCIPLIRGHLAMSSERLRKWTPDDQRLQRSAGGLVRIAGPTTRPAGAIADEWTTPESPAAQASVAAGEDRLVALVHEHRLERRDPAGKVRWAFVADGRLAGDPVVWEDLCFIASRDGWIHCLKLADGSPQWRFFAAAYPRMMIACGQLESSWPLFNVVVHEGRICGAAGYHPDLGGGILAWGLEPRTGRVAWRKTISNAPVVLASREKKSVPVNQLVNGPLRSEGEMLRIGDFAFRTSETDEQIRARLVERVKK